MNVIQFVTQGCDRDDCCIRPQPSSTTSVSWTPKFNKQGRAVSRDPNVTLQRFNCLSCGGDKLIMTQFGEMKIVEEC